jgi:hypothetical protein
MSIPTVWEPVHHQLHYSFTVTQQLELERNGYYGFYIEKERSDTCSKLVIYTLTIQESKKLMCSNWYWIAVFWEKEEFGCKIWEICVKNAGLAHVRLLN